MSSHSKTIIMPKDRIKMLWLLLGAVGFVLLIACVNVANLLLARGMTRQKELAVRSALGAGRSTIFTQLAYGEPAPRARWRNTWCWCRLCHAARPRRRHAAQYVAHEADLRLNIPILLFALAATTLAGLLAGSAPAWYASRVDPAETLKEGGRAGTGAGKHFLRRILVIGEFALALALLAGAGLTIHSSWNLAHVDLGIKTDHVLTFYLPIPESRSKDPDQMTAYYRDILAHIAAVPGVSHATAMTGLPPYGAGLRHAIHAGGWANLCQSIPAPWHRLRHGDSRLLPNLRYKAAFRSRL